MAGGQAMEDQHYYNMTQSPQIEFLFVNNTSWNWEHWLESIIRKFEVSECGIDW